MKNLTRALAAFVLLASGPALQAVEIGGAFQAGNLGFTSDREATDLAFDGLDFFYGGSLSVEHRFSDSLSLKGGFYRDLILRNVAYSLLTYSLDYLSIGVGPFFGTFNSTGTVLKSGLTTYVRLELPGVVFVQLRADNSLAARLVETGDYIQERNDIALGFYVRNAICSLSLGSRKFTQQRSSALEVVDSLTDYSFQADIFQKNAPLRLVLNLSYRSLSKTFLDGATDPVHTLNSIVVGAETDIRTAPYLHLLLGVEASVYTFGQGELLGLSNPGPGGFLFNAQAGFRLDLAKLQEARRLKR